MQTIVGRAKDFGYELERSLAEYRYKVFIEHLGWQLPVQNGMERDQFDGPDTLYVIGRDSHGRICGCARLLPTTNPYLLSEVFPHLLNGETPPRDADVWELSRFAVMSSRSDDRNRTMENTRALLCAAVTTASAQGGKRLITVSPLGIERLLRRMGVHAHRAGPPAFADGKPIFACWIEIDAQTLCALSCHAPPMLIVDSGMAFAEKPSGTRGHLLRPPALTLAHERYAE